MFATFPGFVELNCSFFSSQTAITTERTHYQNTVYQYNQEVDAFACRKRFYEYVEKLTRDVEVEKIEKNKDLSTVEQLLGRKGLALYQAALREEANDTHFVARCLEASTKKMRTKNSHFLVISGVSASGKSSYVAKYIEAQNAMYPSEGLNNFYIIDGGIIRQTSSVRDIAICCATVNGYRGLKDLENYSTPLKAVKKQVEAKALAAVANSCNKASICYPETCSDPRRMLTLKATRKKVKTTNVDITEKHVNMTGESFFAFKSIVKRRGEGRAYPENLTQDMRITAINKIKDKVKHSESIQGREQEGDKQYESKAYSDYGFFFGYLFSMLFYYFDRCVLGHNNTSQEMCWSPRQLTAI